VCPELVVCDCEIRRFSAEFDEGGGLKNRRLSLLFLGNPGRGLEIDRSVPGSVPAAGGTLTTARNAAKDSCPDTYVSRATGFTAVAGIMYASRKCLYLVYLNVCGEVAERLKAAVC
jgi:hypothetical protein